MGITNGSAFTCQKADELQQSLASLTRVLEGSQLGFWDWNIATNEVKRNAIWAEMLGYKFEEIEFTTQQWTDFVHPDDRERAWASIYAVLEGHKAGDTVLQKIAQLMKDELREVDVLGRFGGEEFAILLPQTDKHRAIEVAERLQNNIAGTDIILEDRSVLHVTISIGVAVLTGEHDSIETLLNKADKGLYQAKARGRNTTAVCD